MTSTSCASAGLHWHAAHHPEGYPVLSYEVNAQRADGTGTAVLKSGVVGTAAEMGGLLAGTKYAITVRAKSSAGYGPKGKAIIIETQGATGAPKAPFDAPKLKPSTAKAECTAISLVLPELRGGCGGDRSFTVEASSGGADWQPVLEGQTADAVTIASLDPYLAHKFRLIAVNAAGSSAAGPASAPMLTDPERSKLFAAPTAKAVSSASFTVSWETSPCRPQLLWEILYGLHNETGGAPLWHTAAKGVGGSAYEAKALRCPAGCAFRVRPLEVKGWDQYSQASQDVKSLALARPGPDDTRVEFRLSSPPVEYDADLFKGRLIADLASALGVVEAVIAVAEVRAKGEYCVLDLLGPNSNGLAMKLRGQMKNTQSALFGGQVTNGIDPTTDLLLVGNDGFARSIAAGGDFLGSAGGITAAIAAVVVTAACCWAIWSRMASGRSEGQGGARKPKKRKNRKETYARVEADDDDDDDDDDEDDFIIEQEAKRYERK